MPSGGAGSARGRAAAFRTDRVMRGYGRVIPARTALDLARGGLFHPGSEPVGVDPMRGERPTIRDDVPAAGSRRSAIASGDPAG